MLKSLSSLRSVWFIFRGSNNILILTVSFSKEFIILFSRLNTSFNEVNLSLPIFIFINEMKGLLKIIEKIVPWKESVTTAWELYIPKMKLSI